MSTRFSVLIPTYNRKELVRQTIDSVLAQTFDGYEIFVIDDGSTDGTRELLQSYGKRVQVVQQANQGPEVARNRAAALARGEFLVMLDSDDLLMPCALATYDRIIQEFAPAVVIGSIAYFREGQPIPAGSADTSKIEVWKFKDYLAKRVTVGLSNSVVVVRRSVFEEVGGGRNTTPKTFHLDDFNLVMKTGTYGPCMIVKSPKTVAYRIHETNSIHGVQSMADGIAALIADERAGKYPGGVRRMFARYACIGGIAALWVKKGIVKYHQPWPSVKLFFGSMPEIAAAVCKLLASNLASAPAPLVLEAKSREAEPVHSLVGK